MASELESITVRVPGSTSNIGPGFDCMGIALQIYNRVTVTRRKTVADDAPTESPAHAMVAETANRFFDCADLECFTFDWAIAGEVPISRGLGSSVTLRHGLLEALNEFSGRPLSRRRLFEVVWALEGHPDNASAGIYGGFTCSNATGTMFQFRVDRKLKFILLVPDQEVLTENARSCLPNSLSRMEAVKSLGHACAITAAFATREYEKLRGCFWDAMHQPYRLAANPGLMEVIKAGETAGALGGFLSGSGSSIACLALGSPARIEKIGRAMQTAYQPIGPSKLIITCADNAGAVILPPAEK